MSKRKSFVEAADSLLDAFANAGGGAVNSNAPFGQQAALSLVCKREHISFVLTLLP
jgi:hypothetical protein